VKAGEGEGEGETGDGEGEASGCEPAPERCSFTDEDCDGRLNNELDCTVVAVTAGAVWRVDPFTGRVEHMTDVDLPGAEVLFDVDIDVDGSLLATGGRTLYRLDGTGGFEVVSAGLPFNPNGLAVGADGALFITNHDRLVGSKVVGATSSDQATAFLRSLEDFHTAGDCVHHKGQLHLTAAGEGSDVFVLVDLTLDSITRVGDVGAVGVMGLSSAWGLLFGFVNDGRILLIDDVTGRGTTLHDTGLAFTGAANAD
jgi:hypothetical protein